MYFNHNALPKHVAVIMDGNGRWAAKYGLNKIEGYKRGIKVAHDVLRFCISNSIKYVTLFAFSSENWFRPKQEVKELINLLEFYLNNDMQELCDYNVRVNFIGDLSLLPERVLEKVQEIDRKTEKNDALCLTIAFSYGARQEIINVIENIVKNKIDIISEELVESLLYTKNLPEIDFLIRTGGEKRLSNFMLWQLAYTELYFCDILWPDFTCEHFMLALDEYLSRRRRYGR